jgi:lysozyme
MSAADLIKRFEGCRLKAYPDPATGGKPWTVGYGCTGPGIGPDTVWTQEEAEKQLLHRLEAFEKCLFDDPGGLVKVPVDENQKAALLSLAWNIGTDNLGRSTLLKKLNAGDAGAAASEFLRWDIAAHKVLPGLVKRRAAERDVFLGRVS